MENKIKICETFESIQGEGKFAGYPMLFIRTSGCTRNCWFCDTKYHIEGRNVLIKNIIKRINTSKLDYVCFTGGEPLLYREQIISLKNWCPSKVFHIETNGDLLIREDIDEFDYIACSPKDKQTAEKVKKLFYDFDSQYYDIKVVTDLDKVGVGMISYATILMPLSTYEPKKDLEIQRKVWNYCTENNLKFTPRYQFWIWGKKRKV